VSSLLWIGPPGSGKTQKILNRLEAAVRGGRGEKVRLVTPTDSMARHLLHELARKGLAVSGDLALPIRRLVAELTPKLEEPTAAQKAWMLERAVEQAGGDEFREVGKTPGFLRRLESSIEELQSLRCRPDQLTPAVRGFAEVYRLYEGFLSAQGMVSPGERIYQAAWATDEGLPGIREIYFDGFFDLSPGEQDFVSSLARAGIDVTVTLPTEAAPGFLHEFDREVLTTVERRRPEPTIMAAPGVDEEVAEIARRILEARGNGRAFREIGVIVRKPDTYAAPIRAIFERFGIPFRLQQKRILAYEEPAAWLRGLLAAVRDGFPGEATLGALRRPASPVSSAPEFEAYDLRVRERLPNDGLEFLKRDAGPVVGGYLDRLSELADWREKSEGPDVWAERCAWLASEHVAPPGVPARLEPRRMIELRAFSRVRAGFAEAGREAAELLKMRGRMEASLADFVDALEAVLTRTPLMVPDNRRDVVNVLSAFEARQWELPLVFVCGLVEGWFPVHPPEDLFLGEQVRRRLQREGVALRTRDQRAADEEFLFEIATSRATEELVASYPELDRAAAPLLRSSLLPVREADAAAKAVTPAEGAADDPAAEGARRLEAPGMREELEARHPAFSPSKLQTFVRCPFEFFAGKTLGLEPLPLRPTLRQNPLRKGSLQHDVLHEWAQDRAREVTSILGAKFTDQLEEIAVPGGFRAEMNLTVMREDLERFAGEEIARPLGGAEEGLEASIQFGVELDDRGGLDVNCRIDRFETFGGDRVLVIDYKSSGGRLDKLAAREETGENMQGALYLAGLRRDRGLLPGGLLFVGLRDQTTIRGWVWDELPLASALPEQVRRVPAEKLDEMVRLAEERAAECAEEIRSGVIDVTPTERKHCEDYCDFRDVCRVAL